MCHINRPEGEFFLFPATWRDPLPFSASPDGNMRSRVRRKAWTLNWTKPQPYLVRAGTQYAKKKKRKRRGTGGKEKNESLLAGTGGAYEWMTVRA